MNTVRVSRDELLDALRANRERHIEDYTDAVSEYRKAAIAEINEMLKTAKVKTGKIKRNITTPEPQSFEDSYNTAIKMLEMSVDDDIELTMGEFQQYVEDNWSWRNVFAGSTMVYKKG